LSIAAKDCSSILDFHTIHIVHTKNGTFRIVTFFLHELIKGHNRVIKVIELLLVVTHLLMLRVELTLVGVEWPSHKIAFLEVWRWLLHHTLRITKLIKIRTWAALEERRLHRLLGIIHMVKVVKIGLLSLLVRHKWLIKILHLRLLIEI
jgi:hypothetical protein